MLVLTLAVAVALAPPARDTSAVNFRVAAVAALDSGAVWAGDVVRKASRLIVDRASFEAAAQSVSLRDPKGSDFVKGVRSGAEDRSLDAVKVCTGDIKPRCTLPWGSLVVQAGKAKVDGERSTLTVVLRWPYRELMGFVEYDVTFVKGEVVSVRQVRRS